jgi:hypothetical protein
MPITFQNDSAVIVYALEKILFFARENQYYFMAICAWWKAGVTGLNSGLIVYIDNLEMTRSTGQRKESTNPGYISRSVTQEISATP